MPTTEQPNPQLGQLRRVQASWKGVSLVVQTAQGDIVVPLSESVCADLPQAIADAQAARSQLLEVVSSTSCH